MPLDIIKIIEKYVNIFIFDICILNIDKQIKKYYGIIDLYLINNISLNKFYDKYFYYTKYITNTDIKYIKNKYINKLVIEKICYIKNYTYIYQCIFNKNIKKINIINNDLYTDDIEIIFKNLKNLTHLQIDEKYINYNICFKKFLPNLIYISTYDMIR